MASKLNTYLLFPGNAAQAMQFYHEVFGGTIEMHTFGEYGTEDPLLAHQIMHASLETKQGYTIMASDTAPGQQPQPMGGFAMSLSGDDDDQLRGFFTALSLGGTVTLPLERQIWGDVFGMCDDLFGVSWMVSIATPEPSTKA